MTIKIPRVVLILGLVSFLTDISSEMIYPLLPGFLALTLGASPWALGLIEGLAEATSAWLKLKSGSWADQGWNKKRMLLVGYGLSGALRPMVSFAQGWTDVLLIRFSDRVGKGLRSTPRDAMIAQSVDAHNRGQAFGFHRAMDHAGAVIGPIIASVLMGAFLFTERDVFLWAFLPATLAFLVILFLVKEETKPRPEDKSAAGPSRSQSGPQILVRIPWNAFPRRFRWILLAILVFTLGNSSDAFLLMKLTQAGLAPAKVTLIWSLLHIVKMISSHFGGRLSDKWGRAPTLAVGWTLYSLVYILFALDISIGWLVAVFLIYGIYFGLTEATEKAWMVDLAPAHLQGTALGLYNAIVGFGALPASLLFGVIWQTAGASMAFVFGSTCAIIGTLMIWRLTALNPNTPA